MKKVSLGDYQPEKQIKRVKLTDLTRKPIKKASLGNASQTSLLDTLPMDGLLQLPPVRELSNEPKRQVSSPNVSLLTADQREIFNAMLQYVLVNPFDLRSYVLQGYAGTGKTFLMSMFVEYILSATKLKVAMTAPTHKAVKVMNEMASYNSDNLTYATIHSLLGLREKIDHLGRQTFVQLRAEDCKVGEYQLVIVDESSMLPDELFNLLYEYVPKVKVIFVGDPSQIPPIGMEDSIPLTAEFQRDLDMKVGTLTKVLRQAEENPIIATSMKVRNAIGRSEVLPIRDNSYSENFDGIYFIGTAHKKDFLTLLRAYYNSPNFETDSDFAKVIAWTNKEVKAYNSLIRKMIYGENVPKYCEGEKLIANRVITNNDGDILFVNNEEFEIDSYEVVQAAYKGLDLIFYDARVVQRNLSFTKTKIIRLVHEDSEQDYQNLLQSIVARAKEAKAGSYEAIDAWKEFYMLQEIFADVNYNYAITAHRSQGSTYENVFIIENDINRNRNVVERNRIKYTAFTRPSRKLFIFGN